MHWKRHRTQNLQQSSVSLGRDSSYYPKRGKTLPKRGRMGKGYDVGVRYSHVHIMVGLKLSCGTLSLLTLSKSWQLLGGHHFSASFITECKNFTQARTPCTRHHRKVHLNSAPSIRVPDNTGFEQTSLPYSLPLPSCFFPEKCLPPWCASGLFHRYSKGHFWIWQTQVLYFMEKNLKVSYSKSSYPQKKIKVIIMKGHSVMQLLQASPQLLAVACNSG